MELTIAYCGYQLKRRGGLLGEEREGILLRVGQDPFYGYADCHPWPELGDEPVHEQLEALAKRAPLPLAQQSLYFAQVDLKARREGQSLFALDRPLHLFNHWLCSSLEELANEEVVEQLQGRGFTHIKLKIDRDWRQQLQQLPCLIDRHPQWHWRLDANSKLRPEEAMALFAYLAPFSALIDCIEDPTPFEAEVWSALGRHPELEIACDWALSPWQAASHGIKTIILKPARDLFLQGSLSQLPPFSNLLPIDSSIRYVFTSYLDHPLGQISALWLAQRFYERWQLPAQVCGLASHLVYQETPFHKALGAGSRLCHPSSPGWGWQHELEELEWRSITSLR